MATMRSETCELGPGPAMPDGGGPRSEDDALLPSSILVGRKRELFEITAALQRAIHGHGQIVALSGEPGIGKTRLARELGNIAVSHQAKVLWASCLEGGQPCPQYWPWRQIFRAIAREAVIDSDAKASPQVARQADETALQASTNGQAPQHHGQLLRFDALSEGLMDLSREQPLVIVFDDIHAADDLSLALLGHFLWRIADSRILVLTTYRPAELRNARGLAHLLLKSPKQNAATVRVGPLSADEIDELLRSLLDKAVCEQMAGSLARASGGNPRFAELLAKDGVFARRNGPIDAALRAAADEHLSLSPESRELLEVASVIGDRFDLPVLLAVSGLDPEQLLNRIAEAEAIGLVLESPDTPENYHFVHPVVRSALYDRVVGARRATLHRRIGNVLEEASRGDDDLLASIAEHFLRGATLGDASKALNYCERAAEQACARNNFEEALRLYRDAITAANSECGVDSLRRARLLVGMGNAQRALGKIAQARQSFWHAAELAEKSADKNLHVEALVKWAGWPLIPGFPDQQVLGALETALSALDEGDSSARATLMIRLAVELHGFTAAGERRAALLAAGMEMARRLGDGHALLGGLRYRHVLLSHPDAIADQLDNAQEMMEAAVRAKSNEHCCVAFMYRYTSQVAAGKLAQADAKAASMLNQTWKAEQPWLLYADDCFGAMRNLILGRFDEAERLALRALSFAKPARPEFEDFFWIAMLTPYEEKGRLCEIRPMAINAVGQKPTMPIYRAMLAQIQCALGEIDAARENLEYLTVNDCEDFAHDVSYAACLTALAEVCAHLGDAPRAAILYRRLEPYRAMNASFGPLDFRGPVPFYLGLLARAAGNLDSAVGDFDEAVAAALRMGAGPWVAYANYQCAGALLQRNRPSDRERAIEMAQCARKIAALLGMDALAARIGELTPDALRGIQQPGTVAAPETGSGFKPNTSAEAIAAGGKNFPSRPTTAPSGATQARFEFRKEGDTCLLSLRGRTVRIRISRGMELMLVLFSNPGTEFHVSDLESPGGAALRPRNGTPQLDTSAKHSYRVKLQELRGELEEARRFNDPDRASRIEEEITFLVRELARAVGLRGRDRAAYSDAERARSRTTQAIRSAIRHITEHDQSIGWYLAKSVRTGKFCCYRAGPY
jgi:tetratricopeptide (TPR) repeat protein